MRHLSDVERRNASLPALSMGNIKEIKECAVWGWNHIPATAHQMPTPQVMAQTAATIQRRAPRKRCSSGSARATLIEGRLRSERRPDIDICLTCSRRAGSIMESGNNFQHKEGRTDVG